MAVFADGKIEAYVGPTELGANDDLESVIVEFISGAKKTLDLAIQEIDNPAIAQAILDASWLRKAGRSSRTFPHLSCAFTSRDPR